MTYTTLGNTTSTYADIIVYANTVTNGWMGYGILLIVLSVVFLGTKRYGATTAHAMLASLTLCVFVSGALTIIGAVSNWLFITILILEMFAFIWTYHS